MYNQQQGCHKSSAIVTLALRLPVFEGGSVPKYHITVDYMMANVRSKVGYFPIKE
ncbi:hypothetical protein HMPREF9069_00852 [Atopobium sp. oral taxon 810 str. F0209]|nr:hypothetical protein HMPREF9069_00852 [Atopobium sp. oral taxon 810 str. F0209]